MPLAIVPASQIFGRYEQQVRIAELNKKTPVKTIQSQVDRVTISPEARKAQVLGIARAVREASKDLSIESKSLGESKPTDSESLSYADRIVQSSKEKKSKNLSDQAAIIQEKAIGIKEKTDTEEAAKKKEQYEREATPF